MKLSKIFNIYVLLAITLLLAIKGVLSPQDFTRWYDTKTYINAWDLLKAGDIDTLRTPLYPIFIGLLRDIFGYNVGMHMVIALQWLIFGIATVYLWKSLKICGLGRVPAFVLLLFSFTLNISCAEWNNSILTESLSISLGAFLIYFALKAWLDRSLPHILALVLTGFLLVALRPGNIYVVPIIGLMLIMSAIYRKSKNWWIGLGALAGCCIAILIYCNEINKQIGVFTPSRVSIVNSYACARGGGLINPENALSIPQIGTELSDQIASHGTLLGYDMSFNDFDSVCAEAKLVIENLGHKELNEFLGNSTGDKKPKMIKSYIGRLKVMSRQNFASLITTSIVLVLLAISFCIISYNWHKSKWKHLSVVSASVVMLALAQFLLIAICGPNDFARLNISALPYVIFIAGQMLSWFQLKQPNFKF